MNPVTAVHPTAVVSSEARLSPGVEVGPYAVVGPLAEIGQGTRIHAHAVVEGRVKIGARCQLYPGACIGFEPQDKRFDPRTPSSVVIGDDNIFREYVTVHRAVTPGGATTIGHRGFFMAQSHVGHDCRVGNDVTLANSAALGGHAVVEDGAVIGGLVGVHQHCRVGRLAMIGASTKVHVDVPPFAMADGRPLRLYGVNVVGLKRAGFDRAAVQRVRRAMKTLLQAGLGVKHAVELVRAEFPNDSVIGELLSFIEASKRGVVRGSVDVDAVAD